MKWGQMLNERKRRIGENEAVFRELNQQANALNGTVSSPADTMTVVCECGTRSCVDRFTIPPDAYTRVRDEPTLFITKPGHDFPETETVISKTDGYWIVQKEPGLPASIARATDPSS
jgi:hypothetical protein